MTCTTQRSNPNRMEANRNPRKQLAFTKLESVHVLESWALWQEAGRLESVGFGTRGGKSSGYDEGCWRYLHVESFFDAKTARFRRLALFVAGHKGEPEDYCWQRNRARTRLQSLIELGWAFVLNWRDPIPEVWTLFCLEWNDWIQANPCPRVPTEMEVERGEPDPMQRLVSIRTACELREWELSTVRRWCSEARLEAIKHGDWCIPLGVVMRHERPKMGRPKGEECQE